MAGKKSFHVLSLDTHPSPPQLSPHRGSAEQLLHTSAPGIGLTDSGLWLGRQVTSTKGRKMSSFVSSAFLC